MMRVVFAWELGAFLGHLERDLAVAQHLRQRGADVHFLVADLRTAEKLLTPAGFPFLPSPAVRRPAGRRKSVINFSELLIDGGYDDAETLRGLVRAWIAIWKLLSPDVIVTDFAPTATLSARIAGIPNLPLGPGFTVPPARDPMPAFREKDAKSDAALRAADAKLLPALNQVSESFGHAPFPSVSAVFANPAAQITSFEELDPFSPRGDAQYVGPITIQGRFPQVQWLGTREARVFAYLQSSLVGLDVILTALQHSAAEVLCVIPGVTDRIAMQYRSESFRILAEPVDLGMLTRADVVVGYGSAGVVSTALQAGAPLLLFPNYMEQQLNAERAVRLGAAIAFRDPPVKDKAKAALRALLSQPPYKNAARAFAEKYRNYRHEAAIEAVVDAIVREAQRPLTSYPEAGTVG